MKILLVCNRNLVRSVFAEYFLKFHYPQIVFESCGLNAEQKFTPIRDVANFLEKCGIPFNYGYSKNFSEVRLKDYDSILFFDDVELTWWFRLRHKGKIFFLKNFYEVSSNVPVDPIGFDTRDLEIELVKVSFGLVKFMRSKVQVPSGFHTYAIAIDSLSETRLNQDSTRLLESFDGIVLDLNLSTQPSKDLEIFGRSYRTIRISERDQLVKRDVVYRINCYDQNYLSFLFGSELKVGLDNILHYSDVLIVGATKSDSDVFNLSTFLWSDYDLISNAPEL